MKERRGAPIAERIPQNRSSYRYHAVEPSDEPEQDSPVRDQRIEGEEHPTIRTLERHLRSFRKSSSNKLALILIGVIGVVGVLFWAIAFDNHVRANKSCDTWETGFVCSPLISQFWGQYSPYFSVPSEISREVPEQCKITFVQVLSRHGARDPTFGKSVRYNETVQKIHSNTKSYSESFKFIQDYVYELEADQLSVFGEQQLVNSGHQFYNRYQDLARNITPFIRSADQNRVVQSALNWTQGFHKARMADFHKGVDIYPYPILNISEAAGQNNTLDHGLCTVFENSTIGNEAQQVWIDTFTSPILQRMNDNLPGANLSSTDAIFVMDLCPYETVHSPTGKLSAFCNLFTEKEWQEYDYYQSLGKYYGYGWGGDLGATQGVGFANELIARLTNTPVKDHTSTNRTLDSSNVTFPLGATLYADFSHDNDMTAIFSALGLYNETQPLTKETKQSAEEMKGYSASWTVPFAARAYFEKMRCAGETEEFVKVIVNDRVLPLKTCGGDSLGRCTLSAFVASLSFPRYGGDWDKCSI